MHQGARKPKQGTKHPVLERNDELELLLGVGSDRELLPAFGLR